MIIKCVTFCIDELLWMLSWGWYQLLLSIAMTWFLFIFCGRMKIVRAFALTVSAYAFALISYFSLVAGLFVYYFQWNFISESIPHAVYNPLCASLFLGLIYSFFHLVFYGILNYWKKIPVVRFFILSLFSNTIAALLASCFIKVVF